LWRNLGDVFLCVCDQFFVKRAPSHFLIYPQISQSSADFQTDDFGRRTAAWLQIRRSETAATANEK